jgi:hypothetical protein
METTVQFSTLICLEPTMRRDFFTAFCARFATAAAPASARGLVELDASLLRHVAGGLPKGGWCAEANALPKGGWGAEANALPKGGWY